MKKFLVLTILFWSMIFPNLSFNSFTTDIISDEIHYSDLFQNETRNQILQHAEFSFWLFQ